MPRGEHLKQVEDDEILRQFDREDIDRDLYHYKEIAENLPITAEAVRKRLVKLESEGEVDTQEFGGLKLWHKAGIEVFADGGGEFARFKKEWREEGPFQAVSKSMFRGWWSVLLLNLLGGFVGLVGALAAGLLTPWGLYTGFAVGFIVFTFTPPIVCGVGWIYGRIELLRKLRTLRSYERSEGESA